MKHLILYCVCLSVSVSIYITYQNEALNGGGTLFVNKHPDLRVRVVHGNTLTAAVILNEIPSNVKEVFMTGATSKLGRAIALYLCRKKIRVLVIHMRHCTRHRSIRVISDSPWYGQTLNLLRTSISQMFTMSSERFVKIQREAPPEYQPYLVQVTKYQAAQNCKVQHSVSMMNLCACIVAPCTLMMNR